jgi:phage virion morphogenesis protein
MSAVAIQVDSANVRVALGKFRLSLQQKGELMQEIGGYMRGSVVKTFREEGSPAGSWPRLAPSTIKSDPKFYGAGHKLLIGRTGMLLRTIGVSQVSPDNVVIGTNVRYAAVHQFGSRDRGGIGFGPRTKEQAAATVNVKEHSYARLSAALGQGRIGNRVMNIRGPRNQVQIRVAGHASHQNIPARPYMVFRPEDPRRIQGLVNGYIRRAQSAAGLGGA